MQEEEIPPEGIDINAIRKYGFKIESPFFDSCQLSKPLSENTIIGSYNQRSGYSLAIFFASELRPERLAQLEQEVVQEMENVNLEATLGAISDKVKARFGIPATVLLGDIHPSVSAYSLFIVGPDFATIYEDLRKAAEAIGLKID
mgnify:CR=1 FL=1